MPGQSAKSFLLVVNLHPFQICKSQAELVLQSLLKLSLIFTVFLQFKVLYPTNMPTEIKVHVNCVVDKKTSTPDLHGGHFS